MVLWYATLSRKCWRSLSERALSFSSAGTKDLLDGLTATIAPSIKSEHTIAKHLPVYN
jgi:hypothetical protein